MWQVRSPLDAASISPLGSCCRALPSLRAPTTRTCSPSPPATVSSFPNVCVPDASVLDFPFASRERRETPDAEAYTWWLQQGLMCSALVLLKDNARKTVL